MLVASGAVAHAASFDCTKAQQTVERLICESPTLSALDEALATAYLAATHGPQANQVKVAQRAWVRDEQRRCTDAACLELVYRARLAVLVAASPSAADAPLAGHYRTLHSVPIYNPDTDDWEDAEVEDCLSLQPAESGRLQFDFLLVQTNGHTCSMAGQARPEAGAYLYFDSGEAEGCRLRIVFDEQVIRLEDPGHSCRASACGMRASIDGAEFVRAERSKQRC
ncbi:MAG: lysozyme inhibitor LprI family protein [Gammaproteobacteria bacterium]|nr:lysozyme inhibitor LprI family protein [Gammaproteobacteria bacterium]